MDKIYKLSSKEAASIIKELKSTGAIYIRPFDNSVEACDEALKKSAAIDFAISVLENNSDDLEIIYKIIKDD